jgi:hypothetical protein
MAIKFPPFDSRIPQSPKSEKEKLSPKVEPPSAPPEGEVKGSDWLGKGGSNAEAPLLSDTERKALEKQTVTDILGSLVKRVKDQPSGTRLNLMERTSMEYLLRAYEVTHPDLVEKSGIRGLLKNNDTQAVNV